MDGRGIGAPTPLAVAAAGLVGSLVTLLVLAGVPGAGSAAGDVTRGLVLLFYWLVVPGGVLLTRVRLPVLTKVAVAPLIGLSLLIGFGAVGSWTGWWVPRGSAAAVAVVTLAATLLDVWRGRVRLGPLALRRVPARTAVPAGVLVAVVVVWAASLPAIADSQPSVLGLLVGGPWTLPAAIAATVVVLLVALRSRTVSIAAAAVLVLVIVIRSTASLASPVPIAAYTYKHLGIVEALQQHHHVASGMDIYMNWPGMFAASAYFSDASGVAPIELAQWFTPLVHVLLALSTAALALALGARAAGSAAAAALVVVFNWVGQDYFSPQAVGICLATGVVVLLLQSSANRGAALLALGLFAAIVPTHQLTPFWVLPLAVVLVVLRRVPWWLAAAMAVVLAVYILTRLDVAESYGLISGFDPVANAAGNVPPVPALGREVGGYFAKASSLLVWGSTLLVLGRRAVRLGLRSAWRSPLVLVPAAVCFSPFLLLAGQNYGGEAILRVTLYSTVGCSAVLGPALAAAMRRRALVALAATAWTAVVVACTAQSSFSLWWPSLIQPQDVSAARWLAEQHADAAVVPVLAAWPGRTSADYERFVGQYATLEPGLDDLLRAEVPTDQVGELGSMPLSPERIAEVAQLNVGKPTYVVFTASMRATDAYYAVYTPGSYEATLRGMATSPEWSLVRHQGELWVFLYRGPGAPAA